MSKLYRKIDNTMQIPEAHLDEFIRLYEQKFGVVLDRQTAYEKAAQLLRFVEIIESNSSEKGS